MSEGPDKADNAVVLQRVKQHQTALRYDESSQNVGVS